ncbi:hypothetical protein COV61_00035 [Candidatus Micrarchaeota archaeon CG11_big_fil_rev_8_21_14_0_20_47_5]|nr:MAG: hypothetical protein AUJ17_05850 [Candidatus Micrarchaeota archaeon CG1_02_47_40]PIN84471.1 MAG: hypothetical protein COV61_00035 [Candidatus Micrarchaeota archaeon CG11_big_fil_rev_8_21_14_0_20_47_5]
MAEMKPVIRKNDSGINFFGAGPGANRFRRIRLPPPDGIMKLPQTASIANAKANEVKGAPSECFYFAPF